MDLLGKLERTLEGAVEGVFSRAFRTQLQPIEIAKRLTREVETHRNVSVSSIIIPNVYLVYLSPANFATFNEFSLQLLTELEQYLQDYATEHKYTAVGPFAVRLLEDAALKPNELLFSVNADPNATPSAPPAPSVLRSYDDKKKQICSAINPPAELVMLTGDEKGRVIALRDNLTIGRNDENMLVVQGVGVSRYHAEIFWEDGCWVLRDLGSKNGTLVNGRVINEHVLKIGDKILIGEMELVVR